MYIIPELWKIIKDFLIVKPKEKSFPPYVWIHIKDYMLQEYWMKRYNLVLNELPRYKTLVYPEDASSSFAGKEFIVYTTATVSPQFTKTFQENGIVTKYKPIVTWSTFRGAKPPVPP